MAFKSVESIKLARFNSALSSDFLDLYEHALDEKIREGESRVPSQTFAPSQIRCKRVSWFRLRGVQPEREDIVDRSLDFTAEIGTACHQNIQRNLAKALGNDWINVGEYLTSETRPYTYTFTPGEYETKIEIQDPPIKFAPDGIVRYKGKFRLLEIKTSEYTSFDRLTEPKPQHIDQVVCYGTLLNIPDVLFIYQDRMYGNLKCYEYHITDSEMSKMWDMFREVQGCVASKIAPPKPESTKYCSPSYCRYYNKCKEW